MQDLANPFGVKFSMNSNTLMNEKTSSSWHHSETAYRENQETNIRSLKRLKDHFDVPYEILLAGQASKTEAANKLPMLNHVLSFPTSIYIDRTGEVRRIHTGFAGPGTGEYYQEFVEETNKFVTQLLIE